MASIITFTNRSKWNTLMAQPLREREHLIETFADGGEKHGRRQPLFMFPSFFFTICAPLVSLSLSLRPPSCPSSLSLFRVCHSSFSDNCSCCKLYVSLPSLFSHDIFCHRSRGPHKVRPPYWYQILRLFQTSSNSPWHQDRDFQRLSKLSTTLCVIL